MKPANLADLRRSAGQMAARLRILSHPERLIMLCRMDEGEVAVGELVRLTGLSQSAVSQHLAMLRDEGLVAIRGEAQTRFYRLADPTVRAIIHALCEICQATAPEPA